MDSSHKRQAVISRLNELGISFELFEHEAVFTIEQMENIKFPEGVHVAKNLFLRDGKGKKHFLAIISGHKSADLKALQAQLGCSGLGFASEERLEKFLGLQKGAVSPLGVLNDLEGSVTVAFDKELESVEKIGVHPNENTSTVVMKFEDLIKVVEGNGNTVQFVEV